MYGLRQGQIFWPQGVRGHLLTKLMATTNPFFHDPGRGDRHLALVGPKLVWVKPLAEHLADREKEQPERAYWCRFNISSIGTNPRLQLFFILIRRCLRASSTGNAYGNSLTATLEMR